MKKKDLDYKEILKKKFTDFQMEMKRYLTNLEFSSSLKGAL